MSTTESIITVATWGVVIGTWVGIWFNTRWAKRLKRAAETQLVEAKQYHTTARLHLDESKHINELTTDLYARLVVYLETGESNE